MAYNRNGIILEMKLLIDMFIPFKRIDLLKGINLVGTFKIIYPLITGCSSEGNDGFSFLFIQEYSGNPAPPPKAVSR